MIIEDKTKNENRWRHYFYYFYVFLVNKPIPFVSLSLTGIAPC